MNRQRIRDRTALAAYRVARRVGVQIDFRNPGDAGWTTVWGYVNGNGRTLALREGQTDTKDLTVIVPRQTSFPPTDFLPGAKIRYPSSTGTQYEIDEAEGDNEDILQSSTFTLTCGRFGHCTVEIDEDA